MTTNAARDLLAAEFEGSDVLQRPGSAYGAHKDACQGRSCRETRDASKHMQFDYIEDETVMDRLDEVLGLGAASFEFDVITDTAVRGTMFVRWPDGSESRYQDFGYATRADSAEPYKEAVSDAIRRLGRYVGVARYLYRKHESPVSSGRGVPSSAPRPSAPRPTVVRDSVPAEPDMGFPDREEFPPIAPVAAGETCDEHGVPWNGEPGDLWHRKAEGGFCRHPGNTRKARRA